MFSALRMIPAMLLFFLLCFVACPAPTPPRLEGKTPGEGIHFVEGSYDASPPADLVSRPESSSEPTAQREPAPPEKTAQPEPPRPEPPAQEVSPTPERRGADGPAPCENCLPPDLPLLVKPPDHYQTKVGEKVTLLFQLGHPKKAHEVHIRHVETNDLVVKPVHQQVSLDYTFTKAGTYRWTVQYKDPRCKDGVCAATPREIIVNPPDPCVAQCQGKCGSYMACACSSCPSGQTCQNNACVSVAKVTAVTPTTAILNQKTTFTIIGSNMPSTLAAWIDQCDGLVMGPYSATKRTFTCTPKWQTGVKKGVVKDKPGGTLLYSFSINVTQ